MERGVTLRFSPDRDRLQGSCCGEVGRYISGGAAMSRDPVFQHGRSFREWNIGGVALSVKTDDSVTPFRRLPYSF